MKKETKVKEPSIIIKPIGALGGLDNLHVTLIVVIALLFLLLLVVSYSKPVLITNATNITTINYSTKHNAVQIKELAERVLASYATVNGSLSLLPFISNVTAINITYMQATKSWYVRLTAGVFSSNTTFAVAFLINDLDTSKITPLLQAALPSHISNNMVVAPGVVQLEGKYACTAASPTRVYWFIDPYAAGSVKSLQNATNIEKKLGGKVNMSIKILFGFDTERIASSVGLFNAEYIGKYTFCASEQKNFSLFASNLNAVYSGTYVSNGVLASIANYSKLNYTQLNQCVNSSEQTLNTQSLLSQYYNVTQTPVAIVDCRYLALPQTAQQALCYANNSLC